MEIFNTEHWAEGVALQMSVARAEVLRVHIASTVAVFSDSQEVIRSTVHLEHGPWQQLGRAINDYARAFCSHCIEAVIHWVPGHSALSRNKEADHQANKA